MVNDSSDESSPPGVGGEDATALWRDGLFRRLASQSTPVLMTGVDVRSAASLWAGAREWTRRLREAQIGRGGHVCCAHPDGLVLLQLLVACLWDGIDVTLCDDVTAATIAGGQDAADLLVGIHPGWYAPLAGGWPDPDVPLRAVDAPVRTGAREAADGPIVQCSDGERVTHAQLFADAAALADAWDLTGARVLALGAWHTRAGLTAGLLAPLMHSEELFAERERSAIVAVLHREPVTHVVQTGSAADAHAAQWMHDHPERAGQLRVCNGAVRMTR